MATWTNTNINSATWANENRTNEPLVQAFLLIGSSFRLLVDSSHRFEIQREDLGIDWTNATQNSATWANVNKT